MLYRSFHLIAIDLSENSDLYYEAMKRAAIRHVCHLKKQGKHLKTIIPEEPIGRISEQRKQFVYSFKPDHMFRNYNESHQMVRRMKVLYGASQMDN